MVPLDFFLDGEFSLNSWIRFIMIGISLKYVLIKLVEQWQQLYKMKIDIDSLFAPKISNVKKRYFLRINVIGNSTICNRE